MRRLVAYGILAALVAVASSVSGKLLLQDEPDSRTVVVEFGAFQFLDPIDCWEYPCATPNRNGEPAVKLAYQAPNGKQVSSQQPCATAAQGRESGNCDLTAVAAMRSEGGRVSFAFAFIDADFNEYGAGLGRDDVADVAATGRTSVVITLRADGTWSSDDGACVGVSGDAWCAFTGERDGSGGGEKSNEDDASIAVRVRFG